MTIPSSLCKASYAQGSAKLIQLKLHYLKLIFLITNFVRNLPIETEEEKRMNEVILCISSENELFS